MMNKLLGDIQKKTTPLAHAMEQACASSIVLGSAAGSLNASKAQRLSSPRKRDSNGLTHSPEQDHFHPNAVCASQSTSWNIGESIEEKYDVTGLVGKGGMGSVYKVHHREWEIDLAVKVPLANWFEQDTLKQRFMIEAQTWVNLGLHPNIVQCWYVHEIRGIPCVFMDYLEGGSLKDWIRDGRVKPGDWETILDMILQACYGLEYANSKGIIAHRDIKPGNLLLSKNGHLYVTDFGIVKHKELEDLHSKKDFLLPVSPLSNTSTLTGSDLGTPEYSAPEQWGRASHADARADVYALGGILFELCCGRRPFDGQDERVPSSVLIGRHLFASIPDPRAFNASIPENLAALIVQCLAKEPDERPASIQTLREHLTDIYKELSGKNYWREVPKTVELRSSSLNNRAVSLLDLGHRHDALATLKNALHFDPYHPESVYNEALLLWRDEQITDSEVVRRLNAAKQASQRAGLYLGFVQLEQAHADKAENEFLEVLRHGLSTRNGLLWKALGDARMAQRKFHTALTAYQKALELLPQDSSLAERIDLAHRHIHRQERRCFFPWPHCLRVFRGYDKEVTSAALTADGRFAFLGDREHIRFWDISTGRCLWTISWSGQDLWTFRAYSSSTTSLALTPDGQSAVLAGSHSSHITLWNLATGHCDRVFKGHSKEVRAIALSSNGDDLVSGSADTEIRLWQLESGRCLRIFRGHRHPVNAIALSSDGTLLLSGSQGEIRVWELNTGKYLRRCHALNDHVNALALSPNGKFIISAQRNHTVNLFSINSGRLLQTFEGHTNTVNALAISPDGHYAVSGSSDNTVRVWEVADGRCRYVLTGHSAEITALTFTPDSRTLISSSRDKTLREWNLERGECVRVTYEFSYWLETVAVSQDGKKILLGNMHEVRIRERHSGRLLQVLRPLSASSDTEQSAVRLPERSAAKIQQMRLLPPGESFLTLKSSVDNTSFVIVSPDGRFAVSGTKDNTLRAWDLVEKKCLWIHQGPDGLQDFKQHKNWMSVTALALNERLLISNWLDSDLCLWDPSTATLLGKLQGHRSPVKTAAISTDARFAVSGSFDTDIRRWDLQTHTCLQVYKGHEGPVTSLAMTADGKFFLSGSMDKTIRLWDVNTAKCLRTFEGHTGSVTTLAVSPHGRFALSHGQDKRVRLWRVDAGIPRYHASHQVCLQQDHRALYSLRKRFYKLLSRASLAAHTGKLSTAYTFLSLARAVPGYERDPEVKALNAHLGTLLQRKTLREGHVIKTLHGHTNTISTVAVTPDGRFAVSGSRDHDLRVWVLSTGVCLRHLQGHRDAISCVDISKDKRFVVSGSWDKTLRFWALTTGECLKEFRGHEDYISAAAIAPDGRLAISGSQDSTIRLWPLLTEKHLELFHGLMTPLEDACKAAELTTTKCLHVLRGHTADVSALAISPDGRFAVSGSWDNTLGVWSLKTGKRQARLEGHEGAVTAVAISSNGRLLLSGSRDTTIRLWSVPRQRCLRVFHGHDRIISDVALTADGRFALSASWDKTLRLWNVATGECLRSFERHQDEIEAAALTPDGRFAVSGGRDRLLQIWEFDWILAAPEQQDRTNTSRLI
ncbi:hypothetical protein CSB45_01360 [candidate division KSB3 bacterium]|uniref:Protein kinase domain-containing protein n=1 Tax=candidate division KSB3 bacterium TaxID=2044937 RepID=A0A2G6EB57_9BACT|nr:MAG: hypothetical protein CSB45_01360 [candidate division KSB3 bacterium]PIE30756.1 MAG: hypothetical protein CSA57_01990 [candidate division KSB3 bacterium]